MHLCRWNEKFALGHSFTALDKIQSSEPMKKKVRWLTPNKVCEQVLGSNHSKSESDAMPAEEKEFYSQVETETYL
jgi:hypothetical protein